MCVLAAVLATGCAPSMTGGAGGPAPFVGIELPPRPRDIDVRGIDPCTLLTEAQRAELALETPPMFDTTEVSLLFEGPAVSCGSLAFDPRSFAVSVELTFDGLGIAALTGRPVSSELTVLDLEGFPAVLARPRDQLFCQVLVDLAPGSALSLQFREGGRRTIAQDDLCAGVLQVAEKAMSTLVASA